MTSFVMRIVSAKLWHQSQNLLFTWQQYTVHVRNFPLKASEIKVTLSGTFTWTCSNLDSALLALSDCKGWPGLESQERLRYNGYFATLLELVANCTVLQELLGLWSDFEHAVPYDVRHTKLTWRSTGHTRCPSHKTESFLACPGSQTARLFQSVGWMKPDLLILAFTNYKNVLCVFMNSVETLDNINIQRSEGYCRILHLF